MLDVGTGARVSDNDLKTIFTTSRYSSETGTGFTRDGYDRAPRKQDAMADISHSATSEQGDAGCLQIDSDIAWYQSEIALYEASLRRMPEDAIAIAVRNLVSLHRRSLESLQRMRSNRLALV